MWIHCLPRELHRMTLPSQVHIHILPQALVAKRVRSPEMREGAEMKILSPPQGSPREQSFQPCHPDHPLTCFVSRQLYTITPFLTSFLSCRTSTHHNSNTFHLKWAFGKHFQIPQYLSYYNLLAFLSPSTSSEFISTFKLLSYVFKWKVLRTGR